MAVSTIAHKASLTKDEAKEIFRRHFDAKYKIEDWKGPVTVRRDFMIVKNPFIGVTVKLEQSANETKFVYTGIAPKLWARLLFTGLLSYFLWNGITGEVRAFIETAPEFK